MHHLPPLGWFVLRHEDVAAIGKDNATYSSDYFWDAAPGIHDPADPVQAEFVRISAQQFMFHDPPAHTRMRTAMVPAFTGHASRRWRPIVEARVASLLDRFAPGQEAEFMADFAGAVPVAIVADILGVPEADQAEFRRWSMAFAATFDPGIQGDERTAAIHTAAEMVDYLRGVIADRRRSPRDDLTSALALAVDDAGRPLPDDELLSSLALLLTAGNDTTVNLLGNGLAHLFEHPEVHEAVVRNPSRIPAVVEEMLRMDPPLHLDARKTTRDVTLGGVDIPAGGQLWLVIASANRDPRVFADPGAFDPARSPNRHLTFLPGHHHCIGAPLARLEGEIIFTRLLERFPGIAPAGPGVRRVANKVARGWQSLPVRFGERAA
ncbi:cytochrome P450 [Pseudonocardia broussonetiae]|uniref:Cytochrome P450 n=1 Tax=Pseudonocardia broussonetiae TaxID=2736640 RepID=A0A6M6JB45_9PSEU|nr:cytochrome P450 [Pseudonocardia broussonetiae]QJY44766.1 cytochrome P450 [Pseudonocardia broussonetiae]